MATINYEYSQSFFEILNRYKFTLAISTYNSNQVFLLGTYNNKLTIDYKTIKRPMGMYSDAKSFYIGEKNSIYHFANFIAATEKLEPKDKYNACFLPLNIHNTGMIDIHEMAKGDDLYFVNTKFSCISTLKDDVSFKVYWKPWFISKLEPVDKCHLNGIALYNNKPKYATALSTTDTPLGWKKYKADGGVLIDVTENKIILDKLSMPHSPKIYANALFYLESGKGTLNVYDFKTKKTATIVKLPGFTRGLRFFDRFALVGVSKVRESATFSGLEITKLEKRVCGVWVVDIISKKIVGFFEFKEGIDEIFDITLLPYPQVAMYGLDNELVDYSYILDNEDSSISEIPKDSIQTAYSLHEKAKELYDKGEKEKAIELYKKSLEKDENFFPSLHLMGVALKDLGRLDEAEEVLLKALEKDASVAEVYNILGNIYYEKNETEKAKKYLKKAYELDKNLKEAKKLLNKINKK
ncbi:conserved hypothetical protein [Lebetimonas natsushimae]|uniref:Conserved hypothetical protein CHP03032 domain-containing protein n=1 Tax=Lebetimonas natsushimae TaxID=1936991 RepID=A0A292YHT5_9BACT|nr:TIGR03032 family protein [Lebetimonas natsushimae]GAX88391.1 conserved hypothetical protein [Lebetimonas natsushimae]